MHAHPHPTVIVLRLPLPRFVHLFLDNAQAYKRTKPLVDDVPVPPGQGTVYLGDGCIGATPINPGTPDEEEIYDVLPDGIRHGMVVRVANDVATTISITEDGIVTDRFSVTSRLA
jgi:hypothetical protein